MTPRDSAKGSKNPLDNGRPPRQPARTLSLITYVAGAVVGSLILNNCGAPGVPNDPTTTTASLSTTTAASSSSSSSYSSSSAPDGWLDLTPNLPGHMVSTVAVVPGQDKLIALTGVNPVGYYTALAYSSVDGGATWQVLGQGTGSQPLNLAPIGIQFDPKDTTGNTFWIFGFFADPALGGLYSTTDGGNTFTAHAVGQSPYEIDGMSIDPASNTIVVGQHEMAQAVYKSTDGGATWTNIGSTLPPGQADSEYPYIVDAQTYLIGLSFAIDGTYDTGARAVGGPPGIFRTADGGATWTEVAQNYKVYGLPVLNNGTLYWSYFNGTDGGIIASTDKGVTWNVVVPDGLIWSVTPYPLAGGQFASVNTANEVTLFTPGSNALPTALQPAFPLTATLSGGIVLGLAYDAVRNSYISWVDGGGVQRLDMK